MDSKGHPIGLSALALLTGTLLAHCSTTDSSKAAHDPGVVPSAPSAPGSAAPQPTPARPPSATSTTASSGVSTPDAPPRGGDVPAPSQVAPSDPAAPQANAVPETPAMPEDTGARQRMYVVNTGDNSVSVIDVAKRAVTATIALGAMPHGLATSRAGDRVYVTTESPTGEVIAIDATTNKILWRTQVGSSLNEPALTFDDKTLFAPDRDSQRMSVVDVMMGKQIDSIRVPLPTLHNAYISWEGLHVFQTSITGQAIVKISVADHTIEKQYAINGQPRPLQIRTDGLKLYAQLSALHGFIEVDLASGMESQRISWPEPQQLPPGYDPTAKCHGLGLNPDNTELWATSSMLSQVRVYTIPGLEPKEQIDIGPVPNWMDFTVDGKLVFISSQVPAGSTGQVAVIDTETKQVLATIPVGRLPKRIHGLVLPK